MRSLTPILMACLAAQAMPTGAQTTTRDVQRIVLVTVSSLRADRVFGTLAARRLTPRLNGLAEGGALFTRARTPASSTIPALASLMTGRHPQAHQTLSPSAMADHLPTLAGTLSSAGMVTLAALADPSLATIPLLAAGFDRMLTLPRPPAPVLARRAVEMLDTVEPDRRALLWVHFNDCSAPYHPPVSDFLELTGDGTRALWNFPLPVGGDPSAPEVLPAGARNGPLRTAAVYLDAYDATVRQVDRAIGLLWDALVETQRQGSTLFVVTSLHGEALGDHRYWFSHGQTLYEEELVVPVLFRGPGTAKLREDRRAISLLDLAPTLVSMAGVKERTPTDGLDLASWLRGRGRVPVRYHYAAQVLPPYRRAVLAEGRFKFILQPPRPPRFDGPERWPETQHRELYNVLEDPVEANGIEDLQLAITNELQLWMDKRYPAIPGTPPAEDRSRHR